MSDAFKIQQFRPICLLNCLYKLITKTLTLRLERVAEKLIHTNQTAFMKGRNIMSGIFILHEILHETKRKSQMGIILKLDFEKAYDKVKWNFLFKCLAARGFNEKWCGWIQEVVSGGTVSVKLNNLIGPYIKSYKGVRQGDPLSPILFNFVADGLTRMILKAQSNDLFCGLVDHIITKGIAVLQYADDTIICLKHSLEGARNLKLLLYMYEVMAGLKINFLKSEILTVNDEENWAAVYAEIFNCQIGTFPIKYLGVPVSPSRLHIADWLPLIEKTNKKLDIWKGGAMSIAGRKTLIDSSLSNAPIYQMSIYLLPKTIVNMMDKTRRSFFWQGGGTKKKYHLIRWTKICKSKKKGGLGIKDIRKMNVSLLCKWFWKLENESGLWQEIINFKYLKKDSICTVKHRQTDSAIWTDMLKIKGVYLQGRKMILGNGKRTLFWHDTWLYDKPLIHLFPDLFAMCNQQKITVEKMKMDPSAVTFTRWLVDSWRDSWEQILIDSDNIRLVASDDKVAWKFGTKGLFSVKSVYSALTVNESGKYHKMIWKSKIPEKIKIFLWMALNNAILTKDNMIKRNWPGDPSCYFCSQPETVDHLLFQCSTAKVVWATVAVCFGANNIPRSLTQCWEWCDRWLPMGKKFHTLGIAAICWAIWKARNSLCFENKLMLNPISIVCHACGLMSYWAGLYTGVDREALEEGVKMMLQIATNLLNKKPRREGQSLLKQADEDHQDG